MSWDDLLAFVELTRQKHGVPGVAVGVVKDGELMTAGFGVTNVDHPLPVTDETLFQIGSITKTYTGTIVMRLVEEGTLDMDATVRTYIPEFRVADETVSEQVTLFHLLTHTGGWEGDFFLETHGGDTALTRYVECMANQEQVSPLGKLFSYNNAGYSLLGRIIEIVTGKRFEEAIQEMVLEPLNLSNSFIEPTDVMTRRFVSGHAVSNMGANVIPLWALSRSAFPAGGIICDIKDLMAYARFHLGDGAKILSEESISAMQTRHVDVWRDNGWGLSWAVDDLNGTRKVNHGGGTMGQISWLTLIPEHNFAIGIVTNANKGGFVVNEVTRWALKEYLGIDDSPPKPIDAAPDELAQYAGHYTRPFVDVDLGMIGERLVCISTVKGRFPNQDAPPAPPMPPFSFGLCAEDHLIGLDAPFQDTEANVVRRDDGSIGWLRIGYRLVQRVD